MFWEINRDECIYNHYRIAKDLDEYSAGSNYGAWTAFGWIITHKGIRRMQNIPQDTYAESKEKVV